MKKENQFTPKTKKGKIILFFQRLLLYPRDENFYNWRIIDHNHRLNHLIKRDTNWIATTTYRGNQSFSLPFYEQAIKYYEYKNMIVQRRAQYVIIFLTIVLLIMTGLQIYLNFFHKQL